MRTSEAIDSASSSVALHTIDQLAAKYDVSLRTLRFYEQIKLLNPVRAGTRRLYSAKDEVRLQIILKGRRLGFSLREIKDMVDEIIREPETPNLLGMLSPEQINQQLKLLERQREDLSQAIEELRSAAR